MSFLDPMDCAKAIREMNGKYIGTRLGYHCMDFIYCISLRIFFAFFVLFHRPMKIRKSTWKDRDLKEVPIIVIQ